MVQIIVLKDGKVVDTLDSDTALIVSIEDSDSEYQNVRVNSFGGNDSEEEAIMMMAAIQRDMENRCADAATMN